MSAKVQVGAVASSPRGFEDQDQITDQELLRLGDEWWDIGPGVKNPTPEGAPPDDWPNAWW